jgi:hypothetical protein
VRLKCFPIFFLFSFSGSRRYPPGTIFGVGIEASGKIVIPISFTNIISAFLKNAS